MWLRGFKFGVKTSATGLLNQMLIDYHRIHVGYSTQQAIVEQIEFDMGFEMSRSVDFVLDPPLQGELHKSYGRP